MKEKQSAIPKTTAKRLSLYYRIFKRFHAEKIERANSKQIAVFLLLSNPLISNAQEKAKDSVEVSNSLQKILLKDSEKISRKYQYNSSLKQYVYTEKLGNYDISIPMFLTPAQYEDLVMRERSRQYFREKTKALSS